MAGRLRHWEDGVVEGVPVLEGELKCQRVENASGQGACAVGTWSRMSSCMHPQWNNNKGNFDGLACNPCQCFPPTQRRSLLSWPVDSFRLSVSCHFAARWKVRCLLLPPGK